MGDLEAGFAKLQGEDFEYYMQTYSIILGRNSKKSSVDIDLSGLGGGMNISRQHARIYYDFDRRRFALEVIGKNGCLVEGVLYLPGNPPIKLDSQDLLQIGDKKFYFLLPVRSIVKPQQQQQHVNVNAALPPTPTSIVPGGTSGTSRKRGGRKEDEGGQQHQHQNHHDHQPPTKKGRSQTNQEGLRNAARKQSTSSWSPHEMQHSYMMPKQGFPYHSDQKGDSRRRADHETDIFQQMQAEEKDVVSAVATVLSDLCGPGEWMPMAKLHSELLEHYSGIWHQSRIRKFLTSDDWPDSESRGRPWIGLLALLRKYPEHFVINTRSKGRVTSEFVSLVSLLS
eukprot:Gb_16509 [translate_table: standard]